MTLVNKNKLTLLTIYYKSTLILSVGCSAMCAVLCIFNIPAMLLAFGVCFMTGGTVVSLAYKEWTKQHEYYFYYNRGLSKLSLMLTCVTGNFIIGLFLIILVAYAMHFGN